MGQLDKTKKAIGVDAIDEKARQDMFKKFQDAGGQVIRDKEEEDNSSSSSSRPSRAPLNRGGGGGRSSSSGSRGSRSKSTSNTQGNSAALTKSGAAIKEPDIGSFLNRMIIKFKCWANNITPFNQPNLLPQFMSELNLELRSAIMDFKIVSSELLANPALSPKIAKNLDKVSPIYIELIARAGKVFDSVEINELFMNYNAKPSDPIPLNSVSPQLYSIFKKLYYLYPFQATYKKAVTAAYDNLQRLEGKPALIYTTKRKKILSEISLVFDKYFEKIYLTIIRNENKNIPMISLYMESLLEITDEDRPGKRKAGEDLPINPPPEPEEEPEEEEVKEETKEEPEEELSPELKLGKKIMFDTSIETLRKKHDPKNELSDFPDSDKCFLSYLYFKEFDYEYSVVMTTKKILIQTINRNGVKMDHRQNLLSVYELSRNCVDQFKIYIETFREHMKAKSNPGSNYIEYSKKLTSLEAKRGQQSRNCRGAIREFAEKASESLHILIQDMQGERAIVGNLDEIMAFDSVEARKKLNKKPIKQCISESYGFILALTARLEDGVGDLYGGILELTPEQMNKAYGKMINPADEQEEAPPPTASEEKQISEIEE